MRRRVSSSTLLSRPWCRSPRTRPAHMQRSSGRVREDQLGYLSPIEGLPGSQLVVSGADMNQK